MLVTRPQAQAVEWLQRLAPLGVTARALPLIEIAPAEDGGAAAAQAWAELPRTRLAMFVSPNAVEAFFAARPAGQAWPAQTLAATVGPGSARALAAAGVPPAQIVQPPPDAASLDSEHLWPLLAGEDWTGQQALILRGAGGRDWLAQRLAERGALVRQFGIYQRRCPHLDAAGQALLAAALARPDDHVWLFSSAEAVGHLETLAGPGADWSRGRAIATHARIAARAEALGLAHVVLARPAPDAVAAAFGAF
ncbi:uroporphyrinogen-III synthase [Roseateles sp. DAIF2]|nr:uroporphyrinogen-III synthase [Roseateles sp. DAIF2]